MRSRPFWEVLARVIHEKTSAVFPDYALKGLKPSANPQVKRLLQNLIQIEVTGHVYFSWLKIS